MSRYRTRRNASTQKRLDELKRLEKRKSRVKERISDLTTTKRGTPRVRVDEEALRKARARKRAIDAELRAAKERAEKKAREKKPTRGHKRETEREAPARERKKPARKTKLSKREVEAIRKAAIAEERERAKEERREERRRERAREKSRRRLQAIEDGDYVTLAEIDDISDSEAYTIIWYHESSQGVAA